jgi:hypothetical protein
VDGTVIAASGRNGRWLSRLLSPDRAALGETPDRCAAAGLGLSVERVFGLDEGRYGLTGEQGSVLRMAFERGYYAIPRETAVQDLASEMWVSPPGAFGTPASGPRDDARKHRHVRPRRWRRRVSALGTDLRRSIAVIVVLT